MNSTTGSIFSSLPYFLRTDNILDMKIVSHNVLGPRISARLSDMKKNQAWLAEQMGLSNESISKWINSKADPKLSNLRKVAGILKCSVGYLAGDEDNDSIAEVVRIMNTLQESGKDSVLSGVIAVAASLPKVDVLKTA